MADEVIGGVVVQIGGDWSQMQRDFVAAQSAAQQAGATIATAFNGGAASASGLVDQFGRSIQSTSAAASAAVPAIAATSQAAQQLAASSARASVAVTESAAALKLHTAAAHGSITEIQAISGTLRTFEGNSAFRATERFLTLIPGLGAGLQTAFPVIGAIALGETIIKTIGHFGELSEAEKKLAEVTKQNDAEWERFASQIEKTNVERITAAFGKLAGLKIQGVYDEDTAARDRTEIQNTVNAITAAQQRLADSKTLDSSLTKTSIFSKFLTGQTDPLTFGRQLGQLNSLGSVEDQQTNIRGMEDKLSTQQEALRAFETQQAKNREDQQRTAAQDAGRLSSSRISNEEQLNQRLAELAKQRVQVAIDSSHAEVQAEIDALVSPQARRIAEAEEELRIAQEKQAQLLAIAEATRDRQVSLIGQRAGAESQGKTPQEQADIQIKAQGEIAAARENYTKEALSLQQAIETAAGKVSAAVVAGAREEEKAERDYNLELAHTEGIWAERADKYAEAQSKIEAARAKKQFEPKPEIEQIPITVPLQQRLAESPVGGGLLLDQAGIKTQAALEAQISQMQVEFEMANRVNVPLQERLSLEQQILQARIALAEANGQGDNADKLVAVNVALQQTLQQWRSIGGGNIAQDFAGAATRVPGAVGGGLAAGIFGQGKGIGQEVAQALRGVGQQLLGQVFTQSIQKLVAVMLGNTFATSANTAGTGVHTGVMGAHLGVMTAHMGVMVAHLGTMIANTVATIANTIAVIWNTIVQAVKAIFGFADGGSPPIGVPSIVGERGPELFIPRESGVIVPNHMMKGYADGAGDWQRHIAYQSYASGGDSHTFNFHLNGVNNGPDLVDHVIRALPGRLKARNAAFSPYAS